MPQASAHASQELRLKTIASALNEGSVIPYLGPGVLSGVKHLSSGKQIPADSRALILALNGGKEMAARYMHEFPRAAMRIENARGRGVITRFLTDTYSGQSWSESPLHRALAQLPLPCLIDTNRDVQILQLYGDRPHNLIVGYARLIGGDHRFHIYERSLGEYQERNLDEVDTTLPIIFKPLGCPLPQPNYVASDADFVDYLTELMGGFALPPFLKTLRKGKKYLVAGLSLARDTERMLLSEIMYSAQDGWILLNDPTDKDKRYCLRHGLKIIDASIDDLLVALRPELKLGAA